MENFLERDSIECYGAEVKSKKNQPSVPQNHPKIGKCIKYECTRDGQAEIKKELSPKEHKINPLAKLNLGDLIKCKSFYALVEGFKPKRIEKIKFSGQHNGNSFSTNSEYTYAEVTLAFPNAGVLASFPKDFVRPLDALTKKKIG